MKTELKNGNLKICEICEICVGRLVTNFDSAECEISALCTDSRETDEATLFAAIKGERTDGHDYISKIAESGCAFSLCERVPEIEGKGKYALIVVEDTIKALSMIAAHLKGRLDIITVGVTGSVGKTTTKEFISAVLCEKYRTFRTEGNYNSVIGLPLSVAQIPSETEAAVLEMGMSGFGEISLMSKTVSPDIAVVTTIGTSHMELLGSRENICLAKMEILDGMKEDGVIILCGDEPLLRSADKKGRKVVYIGIEDRNADCRALNIRTEIGKTYFDLLLGRRIYPDIEIPAMGDHNVYAALFAFAVGKECGMDIESVRRGLLNYKSVGMRQNIYPLGGITVIEDCYNASPESMRSAINVLKKYCEIQGGARGVALLGDMLELGENSPALHGDVGAYLAKSGCKLLFTYGERSERIGLEAIKGGMNARSVYIDQKHRDPECTGEMLLHELRAGDVLLVKASRSIAAEKVIEYLKDNKEKLPK